MGHRHHHPLIRVWGVGRGGTEVRNKVDRALDWRKACIVVFEGGDLESLAGRICSDALWCLNCDRADEGVARARGACVVQGAVEVERGGQRVGHAPGKVWVGEHSLRIFDKGSRVVGLSFQLWGWFTAD